MQERQEWLQVCGTRPCAGSTDDTAAMHKVGAVGAVEEAPGFVHPPAVTDIQWAHVVSVTVRATWGISCSAFLPLSGDRLLVSAVHSALHNPSTTPQQQSRHAHLMLLREWVSLSSPSAAVP